MSLSETKPEDAYSSAKPTQHADGFVDAGVPKVRYLVFFLIAGTGAAADLITKELVFRWRGLPNTKPTWWIIDNVLGIETAVNIGAVFGMGAGKGQLFAGLSIVAGIGIFVWLFLFGAARSAWLLTALSMVCGGIIGNLYDRLGLWWKPGMHEEWKSGVRDWILMQAGDAYKWPNYNIADSLLVVGAIMLCWRSFFPPPQPTDDAVTNSAGSTGP